MKLQDHHDENTAFINPEITGRIRQLVQDLEAMPGVSVAVILHQQGGPLCPMAVGGDPKAVAVHLVRLLPGFLVASGAAQVRECPCAGCVAAREASRRRA